MYILYRLVYNTFIQYLQEERTRLDHWLVRPLPFLTSDPSHPSPQTHPAPHLRTPPAPHFRPLPLLTSDPSHPSPQTHPAPHLRTPPTPHLRTPPTSHTVGYNFYSLLLLPSDDVVTRSVNSLKIISEEEYPKHKVQLCHSHYYLKYHVDALRICSMCSVSVSTLSLTLHQTQSCPVSSLEPV